MKNSQFELVLLNLHFLVYSTIILLAKQLQGSLGFIVFRDVVYNCEHCTLYQCTLCTVIIIPVQFKVKRGIVRGITYKMA